MTTEPHNPDPVEVATKTTRWSIQRVAVVSSIALVGIFLIIFMLGLLFAFSGTLEITFARVSYLRNILIILLLMEGILIIGALAVLITQGSRIINLLKKEVRPVITNFQQTANTARVTAEFVGENLTEPIIRTGGFIAGIRVLIREIGGIRRAIRPTNAEIPPKEKSA